MLSFGERTHYLYRKNKVLIYISITYRKTLFKLSKNILRIEEGLFIMDIKVINKNDIVLWSKPQEIKKDWFNAIIKEPILEDENI